MADSNTTKQALANALKKLLEDQPFEKISVSDICAGCHMNRKSFYYHFRDKYDLVNWIFDTEFIGMNQTNSMDMLELRYDFDENWKNIELMCSYFYNNSTFYRRVLVIEGPNSFSSHFRDFIRPLLQLRVEELLGKDDIPQMIYDFFVDGIICAIERWLLESNCVSVDEFVSNLKILTHVLFLGLEKSASNNPR